MQAGGCWPIAPQLLGMFAVENQVHSKRGSEQHQDDNQPEHQAVFSPLAFPYLRLTRSCFWSQFPFLLQIVTLLNLGETISKEFVSPEQSRVSRRFTQGKDQRNL